MEHCPKCLRTVQTEFKFCPYCGKNLELSIEFQELKEALIQEYDMYYFKDEDKKYPRGEYCTGNYVRVGGYSGGNCWNDNAPSYSKTGDIPSYNELAKILENFGVPIEQAIFYLSRNAITVEGYEYEYYGNTSEYETYVYNIEHILEFVRTF